jgi:hypothetical protein
VVVARKGHPRIRAGFTLATYLKQHHVMVTSRRKGSAFEDLSLSKRGLRRRVRLRCRNYVAALPLGSLALIALSLVFCRAGSSLRPRDASCLLLPVATILLVNAAAKVDIGLRHVLPVYPFLFVLASRLATVRLGRRWLAPGLIGAALGLTMISSLRVAPHELAYFNEIVGGPSEGYRYLADSNLDWGQDLKNLKAYTEEQNLPIIYLSYFGSAPPGYYGIRYQYVPGAWPLEWPPPGDTVPSAAPRKVLAISASNLLDVFDSHAPLFRWLRSRQPIAKIGYSIFVFDLTNDPAGVAMVERTYALAGLFFDSTRWSILGQHVRVVVRIVPSDPETLVLRNPDRVERTLGW